MHIKYKLLEERQYQINEEVFLVKFYQSEHQWTHSECWKFDDSSNEYMMITEEPAKPFFTGGGGVTLDECIKETENKLGYKED